MLTEVSHHWVCYGRPSWENVIAQSSMFTGYVFVNMPSRNYSSACTVSAQSKVRQKMALLWIGQ